ncbi:MAG TPA: UvrD-helicase domain-containing protein, partial [Bryobacteraceae bacterium]|nr:UvrD-helicase domain-containing protein [Bryobacteraceae bacterium]
MPVQDSAQRERALSPAGSFIVQAPAGSGKTELLIQRCLVLLARVERPESVVAITFTIKAAAEMRRRLLAALETADLPEPEAEHKRRTWQLARAVRVRDAALQWDLIGNPHRLEIRTIDSLCAAIVRRMPWVSRLGAPPAILEDARELYAEAARQTVALVEEDACTSTLGCLLLHLDNNVSVLQDLIAGMLARRDQWLRHIGAGVDRDEARAALERAIENAVLEALEAAFDLAPACVVDSVPSLAAFAASNLDSSCGSAILACENMDEFPPPTLDALPQWLGIAELLLTKSSDAKPRKKVDKRTGFPPGSNPRKGDIEAVLEALQYESEFCEALHALRSLPRVTYTDDQWAVMDALLTVLPMAVAQLGLVFQLRGQIDFSQVMLSALDALGPEDQPTDLALAFDYRIEHLLVDEFQDTSVTQWQLLERLTAGWTRGDGRTLFLVGDPMQSIYRFREAEVGLFIRAGLEGIGGVRLEPLQLSVNFRSESGIVDWINDAFPGIFPRTSDAPSGAVSFSRSDPHRPAGLAPAVRMHPFIGKTDDEEAARVVEIVRACTGKTAILVRARTHLPSILWALREARIPYRAVEIDCLRDLPVIQDLLALTCALLHPADRIAWLSVLRAPWCGLT